MLNKEALERLSKAELLAIIQKHLPSIPESEIKSQVQLDSIPLSVFDNKELSSLETICKYLKENQNLSYHEIAVLLNRNDRTIWTTYNNSKKKLPVLFPITKSEYYLPISIFKERKLAVLESIAVYLKDSQGLTFHEIAVLLNRNDRTIWTVYNRGKKKWNVKELRG